MSDKKSESKKNIGQVSQPQINFLPRQMVPVPGFRPPTLAKENRLKRPSVCSREDENEFRSAGVLLEALRLRRAHGVRNYPQIFAQL